MKRIYKIVDRELRKTNKEWARHPRASNRRESLSALNLESKREGGLSEPDSEVVVYKRLPRRICVLP